MAGRRAASIALAALLAVVAGAAEADELVTRDGQVIETRGPWEVRGKLLVFKLADGTLASLRLEEADLEASETLARDKERRARQAREQSARPPAEPRQAVLVLTDRDVTHPVGGAESAPADETDDDLGAGLAAGDEADRASGAGGGAQGAGDGQDEAPGDAVAASGRGVQVVQWSEEAEGDTDVAVRGVIQNLGSSVATSLKVNALFYDEAGGLVAAHDVEFEEGPLRPGARRAFSVSLPHSLVYDEIRFQVVGRGFRSVGQSVRPQLPEEIPDEFGTP